MQVEQIEAAETVGNIIQFDKPMVERNQGTRMDKQAVLKLGMHQLQRFVLAGGIDKSSYVFLMLRLLYECNKDLVITLENLIETLDCSGANALGVTKSIKFNFEDLSIELCKQSKKGLLTPSEIPVQIKISDLV